MNDAIKVPSWIWSYTRDFAANGCHLKPLLYQGALTFILSDALIHWKTNNINTQYWLLECARRCLKKDRREWPRERRGIGKIIWLQLKWVKRIWFIWRGWCKGLYKKMSCPWPKLVCDSSLEETGRVKSIQAKGWPLREGSVSGSTVWLIIQVRNLNHSLHLAPSSWRCGQNSWR